MLLRWRRSEAAFSAVLCHACGSFPEESPIEISGAGRYSTKMVCSCVLQFKYKHLPADHLSPVYLSLLRTVLVLESDWLGVRKLPDTCAHTDSFKCPALIKPPQQTKCICLCRMTLL